MNISDTPKTLRKKAVDIVKKKNMFRDYGHVRHPRRVVKIFKRVKPRTLYEEKKNEKTTYKDGYGTVYIESKDEVLNLKSAADFKNRFENKWIKFGFINTDEWYIYDPNSLNNGTKDEREKQKTDFGAIGFIPVNKKLVEYNEEIKKSEDALWEIILLNDDLLNCNFGFNYDQPATSISLTISNDKGKNRERFGSGNVIKVYMWYDKMDDEKIGGVTLSSAIEQWALNTDPTQEDELLKRVIAPYHELEKTKDDKSDVDIYRVNLMFTGIIDDIEYDYSKDGGNKMSLKGRSLGAVLTAARIYKSYPLPGRLIMAHEEVIYDMVVQQTGLPVAHLILEKVDWMIGGVVPKNKRNTGSVIGMKDLMNAENNGENAGAADLNDVTREDIENQANNLYISEVKNALLKNDIELLSKIDIKGIVQLNENGIAELTNKVGPFTANDPALSGETYNLSKEKNVSLLDMENKGATAPIWIYSDGKTGKNYNAGYPDTDLKTLMENLSKLNRKLPVELKPKGPNGEEIWAEYGIRTPDPEKRADGTAVLPVRLFFIDGWNAVKFVMQERAITTSAARNTKIKSILALNDPKMPWGTALAEDKYQIVPAEDVKHKVRGYDENKVIIYTAPVQGNMKDSTGKPTGHFDVIQFMVDLNVVSKIPDPNDPNKVDKERSEVIVLQAPDSQTEGKTTQKKQKSGEIRLIEEALNKGCITYQDALLRTKLFYERVRQLTRAYYDYTNHYTPLACYPNRDSILTPQAPNSVAAYAIDFPVVYPGQKIVLPPDIVNAPRRWTVEATFKKVNEQYIADLKTDIVKLYDVPQDQQSLTGADAFSVIFPNGSDATDEIDNRAIQNLSKPNESIDLNGKFSFVYKNGTTPPSQVKFSFVVIEDAVLLRQMKQEGNDLVFEGENVFEAVKKITDKYFDIIQYVDEFGFYNVRPRGSNSLIFQRDRFTLYAGGDSYPKYIQGKVSENSSQTINRVVIMGTSQGNSELVVVMVEDKVSVREHGVKQEFIKLNQINDVIEAIKQAKSRLLTHRQRLKKVEIVCEPMFGLRPGHIIDIFDIASGLSGSYLVDRIGINYTKNGGATQTFEGYSVGDTYQTDDLEGKAAYYSKGDGDVLKLRKQFTEEELKNEQSKVQR